jgi:hypothetical protein
MRDWSLGPGDPLVLTLAADFRLCPADYFNDHIWELEAGGDPAALALCTTYGLRARAMRLFPRFRLGGKMATDPASFPVPPRLRQFHPNFLQLDFSPFPCIDVVAEYWVPDSHTVAGRFTVTNHTDLPLTVFLELCGQLAPLDGQSLAPVSLHSVNVLSGRTSNLSPVIFLTGGPRAGPGPFPSLAIDLDLTAGGSRSLTWVQAALADQLASFDQARHTAARPWEAERARIEMVNDTQTVDVYTGDPDWDAAFALSQKVAFGLFFGPSQFLPFPSFVFARQPDQGYSPRGDGRDFSPLWSGQSALEAYYITSLLPGAPELAAGLVRNFLSGQTGDGAVNWKPGLAGQRSPWLSAPLLASLAWRIYQRTLDLSFLREIQSGLHSFVQCWFNEQHDRDRDGFPEWDHPLQMGLEDNPAFTVWQPGGQGAEISAAENPALSAMLCKEYHSLAKIAEKLGQSEERDRLVLRSSELQRLTEECWGDSGILYHNRDRVTHQSPAGKFTGDRSGAGKITLHQSFRQAVRLLVRIDLIGETTRRPKIILHGREGDISQSECLERESFQWGAGLAVAASRNLFTHLDEVEISGVETQDKVSLQIMDFSNEDITLLLPLWAGIPEQWRARTIITWTMLAADRFGRPFGIPTCILGRPATRSPEPSTAMDSTCQAVHLPWNTLLVEGLLYYGWREDAAQITARLMTAVIQNLKEKHAFFRAYHSETGAGIGERNALQGLAPLGLFLDTLGLTIQSPGKITLTGKNPFPWPVTVKYRGLTVTRQAEQTVVIFPGGQMLTLNDPTEAVVSAE